jgi:hypothetical protein
MQNFHCQSCGQIAFFENVQCVRCGSLLGLLPQSLELAAFSTDGNSWRRVGANEPRYRQCVNYASLRICNGMVMQDDPSPLCRSCRFTMLGPPLDNPLNHIYWYRLELAKRRLLHSLIRLGLPVIPRSDDPANGLAFRFAQYTGRTGVANAQPIITGHDEGVISVNLNEADDVERERMRSALREPYRTLLGHMRHESGHYYWMRLIEHAALREQFCALFGSHQAPYAQALKTYYEHGAPSDWPDHYVSAYCAAHPWEDWAETWAHYLHIDDTIDTAQTCGLALIAQAPGDPHLDLIAAGQWPSGFDELMDRWFPITYALNSLNRSLGLPDAYPFALPDRVRNKLSFIHDVIHSMRVATEPQLRASEE